MAEVTYSNRLEDQAASAALTSHKGKRNPPVLDEDGKLSSASAAMSLKYAQAQDLPSYPSTGLKLSSAGAAASLAESNKKSFEHWKPGAIPAANKAALLAKDYEADPLWQPELSAAGSKAALLAHRDASGVEIWKARGTEAGHSAAGQALKVKSPNAITERTVPADSHRKALMAATGAMAGNRPRSGSVPSATNDHVGWALKAATSSHKNVPNAGPFTSGDPGFEAARVQNLAKSNVNRQLFGSTPPVSVEVEEKNRQDTLRASAVAMAKKMYAMQQSHIDEAAGIRRTDSTAAATRSHQRTLSDSSSGAGDDIASTRTPRYENLEEAARRLAQERLAKMRDEHAEYRQYYGATSPPARSRLSVRLRRRASTGGRDDDSDDEEQSRRIRSQMSVFQTKVAEVDKRKQQADRNALLEAAHRNVEARMAKLDERVFQQTGKASPAQKELWEQQARARAQKSVDEALKNVGKVHIGGGKYLDQAEVDAIAKARLQPTLDEISETAEKQRARDEEIRLEAQRAQEQLAKEKARDAEVKAEMKAAQDLEKAEAKKRKADEKERMKKEKEEKRKSVEAKPGRFDNILKRREKEVIPAETAVLATTAGAGAITVPEPAVTVPEGDTVHDVVTVPQGPGAEADQVRSILSEEAAPAAIPVTAPATISATETPLSPSKRDSKVKSWFKTHFRSGSKDPKDESLGEAPPVASDEIEKAREGSMKDVAMAGKETHDLYGATNQEARPVSPIQGADVARASSSISSSSLPDVRPESMSASGTGQTAQVGRTGLKAKLMQKINPGKEEPGAPTRSSFITVHSDDDQDFEEAKDALEDEKLPVQPDAATNRPASPRGSHEHSKFKEDL